uniref:Uncharacterized protein n=1 Tax=Knipowitschia caucasica TaxID=637954 RepID=A0AAV2LN04_KNICA
MGPESPCKQESSDEDFVEEDEEEEEEEEEDSSEESTDEEHDQESNKCCVVKEEEEEEDGLSQKPRSCGVIFDATQENARMNAVSVQSASLAQKDSEDI